MAKPLSKKNPFPQLLYAISNHTYIMYTTPTSPTLTPTFQNISVSVYIFNESVPPYFIISCVLPTSTIQQFCSHFFLGIRLIRYITIYTHTVFLFRRPQYLCTAHSGRHIIFSFNSPEISPFECQKNTKFCSFLLCTYQKCVPITAEKHVAQTKTVDLHATHSLKKLNLW